MQQQQISEVEKAKRREYNEDTRTALRLGIAVEEAVKRREAITAGWAEFIYQEMTKLKALDPTEVMPSILTKVELRAEQAAYEAAKAEGERIKAWLRRAIT